MIITVQCATMQTAIPWGIANTNAIRQHIRLYNFSGDWRTHIKTQQQINYCVLGANVTLNVDRKNDYFQTSDVDRSKFLTTGNILEHVFKMIKFIVPSISFKNVDATAAKHQNQCSWTINLNATNGINISKFKFQNNRVQGVNISVDQSVQKKFKLLFITVLHEILHGLLLQHAPASLVSTVMHPNTQCIAFFNGNVFLFPFDILTLFCVYRPTFKQARPYMPNGRTYRRATELCHHIFQFQDIQTGSCTKEFYKFL